MRLVLAIGACACVLAVAPAAASAAFGFEAVEVSFSESDGSPARQAGSHPFAMATTIQLSTTEDSGTLVPEGGLKDLQVEFPPGLLFHPAAGPACALGHFVEIEGAENDCPDSTAIGIAEVIASGPEGIPAGSASPEPVPIYKLLPDPGNMGKIGFVAAGEPVMVDLSLSATAPHRGIASVSDLTKDVLFYSALLTIWGVPADPAHDSLRGQCAFFTGSVCPSNAFEQPLLTLPRTCAGPLQTRFQANSWEAPGTGVEATATALDTVGCDDLRFEPLIDIRPTTELAETPSGLEFDLDAFDDGIDDANGIAQSETEAIEVWLPEGMIAFEPTATCSPAQLAQEAIEPVPGEGCPAASEIGTVDAQTPLLPGTVVSGSVFDGGEAIYVVLRDPQRGILVKEVGDLQIDPLTGQLTVVFESLPQLPVSDLQLRLGERGEGPLQMLFCGDYTMASVLTPWSEPGTAWLSLSSLEVLAGANGGPCPSEEDKGGTQPPTPRTAPPIEPPVPPVKRKLRRCAKRGTAATRGKARARCRRRCSHRVNRRKAPRRCRKPQGRRRN